MCIGRDNGPSLFCTYVLNERFCAGPIAYEIGEIVVQTSDIELRSALPEINGVVVEFRLIVHGFAVQQIACLPWFYALGSGVVLRDVFIP